MTAVTIEQFLDLKLIRKVFLGLAAAIFLISLFDFLSSVFSKPAFEKMKDIGILELQSPPIQTLDYYESIFQTKGLFGSESPSGLTILKASIGELIKDYRLKGVLISSEPEAIIEDARTQKSLFLKTGAPLGDLTVKEIRPGKVILTYYGEEGVLQIE